MKKNNPHWFSTSASFPLIERAGSRKKTNRGFTLIEILLAMFVFGILISIVFGSYNGITSGTDTVLKDMELSETAKTCMDRIVIDLESIFIRQVPAYKKPTFDSPKDPNRVIGTVEYQGDSVYSFLRFSSTAHVSFGKTPKEGIAEIVYYIEEGKDNDFILKRADTLYPGTRFENDDFQRKSTDPILCEHVKSFKLTFFDEENTENETWNSESEDFKYATPSAIGIELEVGGSGSSQFFETMVKFQTVRTSIQ